MSTSDLDQQSSIGSSSSTDLLIQSSVEGSEAVETHQDLDKNRKQMTLLPIPQKVCEQKVPQVDGGSELVVFMPIFFKVMK